MTYFLYQDLKSCQTMPSRVQMSQTVEDHVVFRCHRQERRAIQAHSLRVQMIWQGKLGGRNGTAGHMSSTVRGRDTLLVFAFSPGPQPRGCCNCPNLDNPLQTGTEVK